MARDQEPSFEERREELEREIGKTRNELGVVVHEIERRARQAVDVRRQARLHPLATLALGALLGGALVLAIALPIRKRRRPRGSRLHNLRLALSHLMAHPEDLMRSRRPRAGERLLAAGTSVGSFAAKRALRRWI